LAEYGQISRIVQPLICNALDIILHQILYTSRLTDEMPIEVLPSILSSARIRNRQDGITGVLVFDGSSFYQYLEGEHDVVETCLARIAADVRHTDFELLHSGPIPHRRFQRFSLGYATHEGEPSIESLQQLSGDAAVDAFMALQPALDLEP
jgi:hypothetical protein